MAGTGTESLPDLDDLLQCPVCYEMPLGQIFQCNEGHHVCGSCKSRLEQCPVCRALFFGTRNYAMEELIANIRKLRAFKLGGKVTTGIPVSSSVVVVAAEVPEPDVADANDQDEPTNNFASRPAYRCPQACKGLFRCLCCKTVPSERLPSGRLLNHLRYYHSPELIEGRSEGGEYLQAWQFSTVPGRIVTAVRVADMGVFFLVIEITDSSLSAWLTMAASPWVAHEFCYTVTISGNDREAIFSDCVWSVRSCEGSLKKRGHCLVVSGNDALALTAPATISGKLSVKRVSTDQLAHETQPRAVLRVANRPGEATSTAQHHLQPFLHDLQNGVERLSRAFATLGREADALVRSELEVRARIQNVEDRSAAARAPRPAPAPAAAPASLRAAPAATAAALRAAPAATAAAPRAAPVAAAEPRAESAPRPAPLAAAPRPVSAAPRAAPLAAAPRPVSAAPRAAALVAAAPRPAPLAAAPRPVSAAPRAAPLVAAAPRPAPLAAVPRPVSAAPRAAASRAAAPRAAASRAAAPRIAPLAAAPRPVSAAPRAAPLVAAAPRPAPVAAAPLPASAGPRPAPRPASLMNEWALNPPHRMPPPPVASPPASIENVVQLSRSQRRRLRNRLRNALGAGEQTSAAPAPASTFRAASPERGT